MLHIIKKHQYFHQQKGFSASVYEGLLLLTVSLIVNYIAGMYATSRAGSPLSDIILSNTRVFEVGWIFVYGAIILWSTIAILIITEPKWIPFTLKSIALFILVRAFFVPLTSIGPFPQQAAIDYNFILNKVTFGGDFFLSGHAGIPFLAALLFWDKKFYRIAFLFAAAFFGASVLLGHLHYSIDVFSAYFITYAIFHIAQKLFWKDYQLFHSAT